MNNKKKPPFIISRSNSSRSSIAFLDKSLSNSFEDPVKCLFLTCFYLLDASCLQEAGLVPLKAKLVQLVIRSFSSRSPPHLTLAMTALSRAITIYSRPMLLSCPISLKSTVRTTSSTETKSLLNKQRPSSRKSQLIKRVPFLDVLYINFPIVPKDLRAKFPLYQILISICKVNKIPLTHGLISVKFRFLCSMNTKLSFSLAH